MTVNTDQMEESETETTNEKNDEIMPPETAAIIVVFREKCELKIIGDFETRESRLSTLVAFLAAYILQSGKDVLRLFYPYFLESLPAEEKKLLEAEIEFFSKRLEEKINHGD